MPVAIGMNKTLLVQDNGQVVLSINCEHLA